MKIDEEKIIKVENVKPVDYLKGSSYPSKEAWELALKYLSITAEYAIRIAAQGVLIGISFWKYLEDRIKKLKKFPTYY